MSDKKFITTTLPYSSHSGPHVGHAFEFIIGDALARYHRSQGKDVFFNIGLDEHGLKVWENARKAGKSPEKYIEEITDDWKEFCQIFRIKFDNFYKTSSVEHREQVAWFWDESIKRGDVYKKKYKGLYCVGCESFKLEKDLKDGICPDHPETIIDEIEEENYFFRLSKYKDHLKKWLKENPGFLTPLTKLPELENIIENIQDISVSRLKKNVPWGTQFPGDPEHVVYVWACALLNYIFAAEYYTSPDYFKEIWDDTTQICGPDNLKFQAVIFQGLLASAGIKQTKRLLVHGTILDGQGRKMSKTLGNVVDPIDQVNKYGIDAVRYYALAGLSIYGNSSWDEGQLVELYNSHLADDFGNLLSRVCHLIDIKNIEILPDEYLFDLKDKISQKWENNDIGGALHDTNQLVKWGNKHIGEQEPWKDTCEDPQGVISRLYWLLVNVALLYVPVIPDKIEEVREALHPKDIKKVVLFPKIEKELV